ncbi:MAG: helix-hairpin-helix domain-containing protein, partial [Actinomycetales bacterium]
DVVDSLDAVESIELPAERSRSAGRVGFARRLVLPDRASMRAVVLIAVLAAVVVGWMWWQGRPRPVVQAPQVVSEGSALVAGDSSSGEVVVHVTGAVKDPGLVRLPTGSRVDDAISAAGGARSPKALDTVNLARVLVDGEQIVVGAPGGQGAAGQSSTGAGSSGINLNQASARELEDLPGVGPVLAQRIVDWRTANGPFRSVDELGEVSGIGDALLSQIRTLARV